MPDETITQRISVEGADPLTLSGVNDANLTELAKQTGARVALRGDILTVSGPSDSVDRASAIAQRMIDAARQLTHRFFGAVATGSAHGDR